MEDIKTERIGKAIHFVESNLSTSLNLDSVAAHACISKYHFSRQFKAITGDKLGDYIRRRRITESAFDLITTKASILEIAEKYQFDSQEAYTRSFKNVYQITPNVYRKNGIHQLAHQRSELTTERINHLKTNISLKPEIIGTQQKKLIGLHCKTSLLQNNIPTLWKIFMRRKHEIVERIDNGWYGISGYSSANGFEPNRFSSSSMIEKWATVEVKNFDLIPSEMVSYKLTGGNYAKFIHRGGKKNVQMSFEYMYSVWLPNSIYELDDRDHFEHYPKDYKGPENPESELAIYLPIKLKYVK